MILLSSLRAVYFLRLHFAFGFVKINNEVLVMSSCEFLILKLPCHSELI